jgi:impB/mucB/samB family
MSRWSQLLLVFVRFQKEAQLLLQYNPFGDLKTYSVKDERIFNDSNGSIIAISYGEARKLGCKRGMRGGEARKLCPSLQLVQVPTLNGKADLTVYRKHGQDVLNVLAEPDSAGGTRCTL